MDFSTTTEPEPWLRGELADVPTHVMPVFFSFAQVREDLRNHTHGITHEELWHEVAGKHSLGYHLKHIAGSVDRLTTYLMGGQLNEAQLEFLSREHVSDAGLADLLALVNDRLRAAERQLLQVSAGDLFLARSVGRKMLPTSVMGLIVHVCEHTQRHLGQAILLAKLTRQS